MIPGFTSLLARVPELPAIEYKDLTECCWHDESILPLQFLEELQPNASICKVIAP